MHQNTSFNEELERHALSPILTFRERNSKENEEGEDLVLPKQVTLVRIAHAQ